MAKQEWQELLELMYEYRVIIDPDMSSGWMSQKDASIALGAAKQFHEEVEPEFEGNLEEGVEKLKIMGFVRLNDNFSDGIAGLTSDGWKFAHQQKTERQRHRTNIILSFGTIIVSLLVVILHLV